MSHGRIINISGIAIILMVFSASGCTTSEPVMVENSHVQVQALSNTIPMETMNEIAARSERIYTKLAAFFGRNPPSAVRVELGAQQRIARSFAERNTIVFPMRVVESKSVIIAHEMTHLFMPERHSEALREGIAVYAQDRFGEVSGYPNYGVDVDRLLSRRLRDGVGKSVASFSGAEAFFRRARGDGVGQPKLKWKDIDQEARRNAYLAGGSFTRYLFEVELQSDMTRFRTLYVGGDIPGVTGKSLQEIEAAWWQKIGLP